MPTAVYRICIAICDGGQADKPTFENATPVGFSSQDSTVAEDFVVGSPIGVRVDIDRAATSEYPVIGHFHSVEQSVQVGATDTDGMQVDIAMTDVVPLACAVKDLHLRDRARRPIPLFTWWIEQTAGALGSSFIYTGGSTPLYRVLYARSFDGGASFSTPVAVSGQITYHPLTTDGQGIRFLRLTQRSIAAVSPRVVYAFVSTADHERKKTSILPIRWTAVVVADTGAGERYQSGCD